MWAWGGAAILFVDTGRKFLWCACVDGSGLYGLGVTTTDWFNNPYLDLASGWYYVNSWDPANQTWKLWKFGAGGYNITLLASGLDWGFALHPDGHSVIASGVSGGRFQLYNMPTDLSYQGSFVNRDDTATCPDARHPAYGPYGSYIAYQTGDLVGVNRQVSSTYKYNDIARLDRGGGVTPVKLGVGGAAGSLALVDSPSWSSDSGVVIYDFSVPQGSGIWAIEAFVKPNPAGAGVYGNPFGPGWQFGNVGSNRLKHR